MQYVWSKCKVKVAFPNPLQVHQYYPLTPTLKLLGSSVKWAQILHSQELQLIGSEPTTAPALCQYLCVSTLQATRPWLKEAAHLWRWRKDLDYSPSPLSWPTFHTDPGHNSQKKMEGKCIFPRSQVILPWLANCPQATKPIRPQQWGLSSITLIPVTLPLRRVWENWNIRK